ncbi:hypothetical protein UlMin_004847 [Ulmus minor]
MGNEADGVNTDDPIGDINTSNKHSQSPGKRVADEELSESENEEIVDSEYEQDPEDIAADTCVDPTTNWDSLKVPEIPRAETGSGSDKDDGSDDLRSLDGSDIDEQEVEVPCRRFIKKHYHEFNPTHDLQNPVFKLGMEFGNADMFRKAVRVHAVTNRRAVKFSKNDPNRVRAVCKAEGCKWFVFASWLSDHMTFKVKSLQDEHTCAMVFKNKFVTSRMIAEKYVDQWRANPEWNFGGMSQQLRVDTNVDASLW